MWDTPARACAQENWPDKGCKCCCRRKWWHLLDRGHRSESDVKPDGTSGEPCSETEAWRPCCSRRLASWRDLVTCDQYPGPHCLKGPPVHFQDLKDLLPRSTFLRTGHSPGGGERTVRLEKRGVWTRASTSRCPCPPRLVHMPRRPASPFRMRGSVWVQSPSAGRWLRQHVEAFSWSPL